MSSKETQTKEILAEKLRELTADYLPDASWTIGGAFRFDTSLQTIITGFASFFPVRKPHSVAGTIACAWSLDWFVQRRPMPLAEYAQLLETYAQLQQGVMLIFDNPFITPEQLNDSYALTLVDELYKRDRIRKNTVCVASDALAEHLRARLPHLPIICHPNRLVCEQGRRTTQLYNTLLQKYDRIFLHPTDATRPAIYSGIADISKVHVVINDPCHRTCPVRREHMRLLAEMRRNPYNTALMSQREALITRNGCHKIDAQNLQQKLSCNLTRDEAQTLYAAGVRSFTVQSNQFRNEMTLLWDIFQCMLDYSPHIDNKAAVIATSLMAQFGAPSNTMPSGLRKFSFSNYE